MAKTSRMNIPTLPEHVEMVRSLLQTHGVLEWREIVVGENRTDLAFRVTREQEDALIHGIPHHIYALLGVML